MGANSLSGLDSRLRGNDGYVLVRTHVHQPAPMIRTQRLARRRLAHQLQSCLQLTRVALQALTVEGVAAGQVLPERAGGPLAKVHTALGVHPVADRNNGIQVVVLEVTTDLPPPLPLNYRVFLGSYHLF